MKQRLWVGIRCAVYLAVLSIPMEAQEPWRIDLHNWGYKTSEYHRFGYLAGVSPQLVSVAANGEMVAGFVTRDRMGLARRELPPLSLHVVRFGKNRKFLFQGTIPTPTWDENAILYGSNGTLLIKAGTKLGLYSPELQQLAGMELLSTKNTAHVRWRILPLPNRSAFLLHNYDWSEESIGLLKWDDLKPIRECVDNNHQVSSVSNREMLSRPPSPREYPSRRTVEAAEICGPSLFSYSWEGDPLNAVLVGDDRIILAGSGSFVSFVVGGKVQWTDAFNKKADIVGDHVEVSADSKILAVTVSTWSAWRRALDLNDKLKSVRIIVYEASSGRRISDVLVNPAPSSSFDFALSPKGDLLAVLSDGFLEIFPLKQ